MLPRDYDRNTSQVHPGGQTPDPNQPVKKNTHISKKRPTTLAHLRQLYDGWRAEVFPLTCYFPVIELVAHHGKPILV